MVTKSPKTQAVSLRFYYYCSALLLLILQIVSVGATTPLSLANPNHLRFDLDEFDPSLSSEEIRPRYSTFPGQSFYQSSSWSGSELGTPEHWEKTSWSSQGKNKYNNRRVLYSDISSTTLNLTTTPTFEFVLNESTSTTPAIIGNSIIVPSWDGGLRSIHRLTGKLQWKVDIGMAYFDANVTGAKVSRTTPTFVRGGEYFIIGTMAPAELLYVRTRDGMLIGNTTLDEHPWSAVTMSGTVSGNIYLVGISSLEKIAAMESGYVCCNFTGSMVAVDLTTGDILWKTYTISENVRGGVGNYSGVALWGSSPAVWSEKNLVFVASGNNYESPEGYDICIIENNVEYCNQEFLGEGEYNHIESVIAYDTNTGEVAWVRQMAPRDSWNAACVVGSGENCPDEPGADYDFGMAPALDWWCYLVSIEEENLPQTIIMEDETGGVIPNLPFIKSNVTVEKDELTRTSYNATHNKVCIRALFIGQKSGIASCLRASTGSTIWSVQLTPGGPLGGLIWGLALDDNNVYVSCPNSDKLPWHLANGTILNCGGWAACDKNTGEVVWTTADPACFDPNGSSNGRVIFAGGSGPPTVVNDVVLVGSKDTLIDISTFTPIYGGGGWVYALNVTNGEILSSYETNATVYGGFAANNDCVYIGSGYRPPFFVNSKGTSIFAWCTAESLQ